MKRKHIHEGQRVYVEEKKGELREGVVVSKGLLLVKVVFAGVRWDTPKRVSRVRPGRLHDQATVKSYLV